MNINGIQFKGFKSFNGEFTSIESFPNMTVFVGKNNSGKSSCIDILESLTSPEVLSQNNTSSLKIIISHILTERDIASVFSKNTYGGLIM